MLDILAEEGVTFKQVDVDLMPPSEKEAFAKAMKEMTGFNTLPLIFINGKCCGNAEDLRLLLVDGKLEEMLPQNMFDRFKVKKPDQQWQVELGNKYYVLRQKGTEAPGSHPYDRMMPEAGHFACGACGLPLYSADSKFRSNCGWPVFDKCYYSKKAGGCHVGAVPEFGGMEIVCNRCESHLGHVFFDTYSKRNPNGERH